MSLRRLASHRPRFVYRRRRASPRPVDVGRVEWVLRRAVEELRRYGLVHG